MGTSRRGEQGAGHPPRPTGRLGTADPYRPSASILRRPSSVLPLLGSTTSLRTEMRPRPQPNSFPACPGLHLHPDCRRQGPWNADLRTPPGPEGSNGSLLPSAVVTLASSLSRFTTDSPRFGESRPLPGVQKRKSALPMTPRQRIEGVSRSSLIAPGPRANPATRAASSARPGLPASRRGPGRGTRSVPAEWSRDLPPVFPRPTLRPCRI